LFEVVYLYYSELAMLVSFVIKSKKNISTYTRDERCKSQILHNTADYCSVAKNVWV